MKTIKSILILVISFSMSASANSCIDNYKLKLQDAIKVTGEDYLSMHRKSSYSLMVAGIAFSVLGMPFIGLGIAGSGAAMPVVRDKKTVEAIKQKRLLNTLLDVIDPARDGHGAMKELVASTVEVNEGCRPRFEDVYSGLRDNVCKIFKQKKFLITETQEVPPFNKLVSYIKDESQCHGGEVNDSRLSEPSSDSESNTETSLDGKATNN